MVNITSSPYTSTQDLLHDIQYSWYSLLTLTHNFILFGLTWYMKNQAKLE